jgi:hypothetical protein
VENTGGGGGGGGGVVEPNAKIYFKEHEFFFLTSHCFQNN